MVANSFLPFSALHSMDSIAFVSQTSKFCFTHIIWFDFLKSWWVINLFTHLDSSACTHIYVCMYVCIHVYIYSHIFRYRYTYMHRGISRKIKWGRCLAQWLNFYLQYLHSQIRLSRFEFWLHSWFQLPAKVAVMGHVAGSLLPRWLTWMEFLALRLACTSPHQHQTLRAESTSTIFFLPASLCHSVSVFLCLSNERNKI